MVCSNEKNFYSAFNLGFFKDYNNSVDINKIGDLKFTKVSNHYSFGNISSAVWLKLEIKNITEMEKEIFIHNDFAYFSKEITIYEYQNHKIIDKNIYKTFDNTKENKLTGSVLVYKLHLEKKGSKTLYIKILPVVTQVYELNIYDEKTHLEALINNTLLSNTIITILLSLAFYNIFLYLFNRKKEFMLPRQVGMYLLKTKMNYTYERIGNIFNGRNHASVLYSCKKMDKLLKKDKTLLYEVNAIKDGVGI